MEKTSQTTFFDLPTEIRNEIYSHLLFPKSNLVDTNTKPTPTHLALSRTSRFYNQEVSSYYYSYGHFIISPTALRLPCRYAGIKLTGKLFWIYDGTRTAAHVLVPLSNRRHPVRRDTSLPRVKVVSLHHENVLMWF